MLGDLIVDARLTYNKQGQAVPNIWTLGDLAVKVSVRGKFVMSGRVTATTSDATLLLGNIGVIGFVALKSFGTSLCATPAAPTVQSVLPGATTYSYSVVAKQADGSYTQGSPLGTIANGNATLGNTSYNVVNWKLVDDAVSYDIYRVIGQGGAGNGLGLIQTVASPGVLLVDNGLNGNNVAVPSVSPYDFRVGFGSDGSSYPVLLRGGDEEVFRWNAAALHFKALATANDFAYLLIED